jgi:hypothetical protein
MVAGFSVTRGFSTIDGSGKDPRAGGFTHAPWTAEQVCVTQVVIEYGVLQRGGNGSLTHHVGKGHGAILPGRNNKILHEPSKVVIKFKKRNLLFAVFQKVPTFALDFY